MTATVEAHRDRIVVTGATAEQVREETLGLFLRCGAAYADFTSPVQQPNGAYVATGLVRLNDTDYFTDAQR